ncbi:hypothetical protein LRR81_18380 [Metabacillus sp. GX 13764]|uniref:hypothetical protein n=1 Tax=Metabacillus kandeliae TaxID=2900151 RepID=UPI001E3EFD4E|nr:hypothetical protein [Metabacillus kandeliae]MCD7036214.1 hypothetical protein [Metabacillus kandeliae]
MFFKKRKKHTQETSGLKEQIAKLEKTVHILEKQLSAFMKIQEIQRQRPESISKEIHHIHKETENETLPMVYVEKIHIETLHMKELDLSNNLGQLGVKDLTGQLFIGTTYGKEHQVSKKISESEDGPKINYSSKTEKGPVSDET